MLCQPPTERGSQRVNVGERLHWHGSAAIEARCGYAVAMDITLSTPALLFPAISLLLLAYTNRFLAVASVIRSLHATMTGGDPTLAEEIAVLRDRVALIRAMQGVGVLSLFFCVLCMFMLFVGWTLAGKLMFGTALLLLLWSLGLSVREIALSGRALNLHLRDIERR